VGILPIRILDDAELVGPTANLCGYPTDLDDMQGKYQYYHARRLEQVTPSRLCYDIDTHGGMSGGPLWLRIGEDRFVVGVHTNGSPGGNWGVRISKRVADEMDGWRR
jgi:V8-like Glu-specific endopeptidase